MSHEISVSAPKAGVKDAKVVINQWPEGEGQAFIDSAVKLWGPVNIAQNLNTIAEQKSQNSCRGMLNPDKDGSGTSLADVQKAHADWKLGASRPRGSRAPSSEAYMASLEAKSPEEILAEIEKMKALVAAKKGK